MAENNTVLVVAVLAVIASLAAAGFSYYSLSAAPGVSGFASSSAGTASLSVQSLTEINFVDSAIAWGTVSFNASATSVTLDSVDGSVLNGHASTPDNTGLVLENDGNDVVSVTLAAGSSAATFIGGTSPSYQWKVSASNGGRDGCPSGNRTISSYTNTATSDTAACSGLGFVDSADQMRVDVKLVVPYDAPRTSDSDTITAKATEA